MTTLLKDIDCLLTDLESEVKEEEEKKPELLGIFRQPIPPEDKNDPFDRQKCIPDWNDKLISSQVALVLGVGGIGCSVAFTLARLGIKKMYLVDCDVVDTTNLNRQILFTKHQIGHKKVNAAKYSLIHSHIISIKNNNPIIETHHFNVLDDWQRVVKLAKQSNIIFNNIDVGNGFDIAVLQLCFKLNIPYSSGSSYCHSWINEYFNGNSNKYSSFTFNNPEIDSKIYNKIIQNDNILNFKSLRFIPPDNNPDTRLIGSNVIVASMGGIMSVNNWIQGLIQKEWVQPNYTKMDVSHYWDRDDLLAWPHPEKETKEEKTESINESTKS